jgi:hypothetical protein
MKRLLSAQITLLGVFALSTLRCSTSTAPVAGGTGLGNPTTPVALSMVADTGLASGTATLAKNAARNIAADKPDRRLLTIRDIDTQPFTIDTATIAVQEIRLLVVDASVLDTLTIPAGLQRDADGIILPGPYVFDVMRGTVTPSIDKVVLPSLRYSGVMMAVKKKDLTDAVTIGGTYMYKTETHRFSFKLLFNLNIKYRSAKGDFVLDGAKTAHLTITLNASQWLDSADLAAGIDKGKIGFDSTGVLVIDSSSKDTAATRYAQAIRRNIIASGALATGW